MLKHIDKINTKQRMGSEVCWNNLPIVVLNEVFYYLSKNDKIRASSTCTNWRFALSHPRCWRNVEFAIKLHELSNAVARSRFLIDVAGRKLHNVTINFDSMDVACVEETCNVLNGLSENVNLKKIILMPSNCSLVCPGEHEVWPKYIESHFAALLLSIVKTSHCLETLSLGCLEEIISTHAKTLLEAVVEKHANSIKVLGLASIKDYPDDYFIPDLNISLLKPLKFLQILSIDYCHVNNNLLHTLSESTDLRRLVIHVHGIMDEHPGTSEEAWSTLTRSLPGCELRLTLIHSYDGVDVLHSKILKREMPLTHIKVFFCEKLNVEAVDMLTQYARTLRSVWWVDSVSLSAGGPATNTRLLQDAADGEINPFVMCCWRCTALEELVFIGHKYLVLDVYAVIRLRGATLRHLCLAAADMAFAPHDDPRHSRHQRLMPLSNGLAENYGRVVATVLKELQQDISECLRMPWTALEEPQLHPVVWHSDAGDSDEFVLPIVMRDLHDPLLK